ncbi:uncharacterized protein LOC126897747 [Daktulosphaira vitifoliae]|uniref:uncharacterized protein LOC126897747 n=1 Tax=Daktulosphaira vitifoliae TaxID=58002 RepID=UPI0021AA574E|nr:uncharacterized protein LOC126897747 [Daktulosphaira vitifoliae]
MPMRYYNSIYNHKSSISRNSIKKYRKKNGFGLLPSVNKRVTTRVNIGGDGERTADDEDTCSGRAKSGYSVLDILSSSSFRFVMCAIIVFAVLLYKTFFTDSFYSIYHRVEPSTAITTRSSRNASEVMLGDDDDGEKTPSVEVIEISPNCGLQTICPDNTFPVHVYTGRNTTDFPKLCVMGKYIVAYNRSVAGRGINVVLVEPSTYTVAALKNFDTYERSSSEMDVWLEAARSSMKSGHVAIFFTFDEASKKLTKNSRNALYEMGSGRIQDLRYRCQWYMVTQKGIRGITPYEKITYSHKNVWAEPLDDRFCVPFKIEGNAIVVDEPTDYRSSYQFCNKPTSGSKTTAVDDQYGGGDCDESNDDDRQTTDSVAGTRDGFNYYY